MAEVKNKTRAMEAFEKQEKIDHSAMYLSIH
jgi:hypothetical protein